MSHFQKQNIHQFSVLTFPTHTHTCTDTHTHAHDQIFIHVSMLFNLSASGWLDWYRTCGGEERGVVHLPSPELSPPTAPPLECINAASCWEGATSHSRALEAAEETEQASAASQRHGELLWELQLFRPEEEHQCPGQPAGRLLCLADCDDHSFRGFHPLRRGVKQPLARVSKVPQHHQRHREWLLLQISQWVPKKSPCRGRVSIIFYSTIKAQIFIDCWVIKWLFYPNKQK